MGFKSEEEARQVLVQFLEKVLGKRPWMIAVWSIDEGRILLDRVSYQFPNDDKEESVKMLRDQLRPLLSDEPLPLADFLKKVGEGGFEDNESKDCCSTPDFPDELKVKVIEAGDPTLGSCDAVEKKEEG